MASLEIGSHTLTVPHLEREPLAWFELQLLLLSPTYYGVGVEKGHGQPVMVIPGFLGSDVYLGPLNWWLSQGGYHPTPSHIANFGGGLNHNIDTARATLERTHQDQGAKTVLIGHSLGGVMAFYFLRTHPDLVSTAIVLGSPLVGKDADNTHPLPEGGRLYSIHTRQDGIIDWRACLHPQATNIEVHGTHSGLVWNAEVFRVIAQLLQGKP